MPNADYLEGSAPNDVKTDDDLKFDLFKKNAEFLASNQRNIMKRANKLERAGSFRATEKMVESLLERGNRVLNRLCGKFKKSEALESLTHRGKVT